MTADQAKKLRAPFPPEVIGKLPKGGAMLDFVGHAACTDRLLQVDPEWTWEPLALSPEGLPALDRAGNLWIRLTICGVTRIGVGDGKSAKECIGDAIRNAAMRFGVALDLWAKEDLTVLHTGGVVSEADHQQAGAGTVAEPPAVTSTPASSASETASFVAPSGPAATKSQRDILNVLVGKLRDEHKKITTEQLWRAVRATDAPDEPRWSDLRDSLTKVEAHDLIERLTRLEENLKAQEAA